MKKYLLLCLLANLLLLSETYPQIRTVSGRLTDSSGEPLIGASILVKGTTIGTVTDIDGSYVLNAPVGSTLVISYTGFATREVTVPPLEGVEPEDPAKTSWTASPRQDRAARLVMDSSRTPYVVGRRNWDQQVKFFLRQPDRTPSLPYAVYKIRYMSPDKVLRKYGDTIPTGLYVIHSNRVQKFGLQLSYNTAFSWERPNRLPQLQQTYVQGRPENGVTTWRGPESGEFFSWGPPMANLEYDGASYPYDKHGRLGLLGTGNGQGVQAYDPYAFLRGGSTTTHEIDLGLHYQNRWFAFLTYDQRSGHGMIPGADRRNDRFQFKIEKKDDQNHLHIRYRLDLSDIRTRLGSRGNNLANLFYAITSTPPSFDNSNGNVPKKAIRDPQTFTTTAGQMRSYWPGQVANPYFLINKNVNEDQTDRVVHNARLDWDFDPFQLSYKMSYTQSGAAQQFAAFDPGSWEQAAGSSVRKSKRVHGYAQLGLSTDIHLGGNPKHQVDAGLIGEFFYDRFEFQRNNWLAGETTADQLGRNRERRSSDLFAKLSYHFNDILNVDLQNTAYFSSTLRDHYYFNPAAGISLHTDDIPFEWDAISFAKVFATASRTISELPVDYNTLEFGSLNRSSDQFPSYFEQQELFYQPDLLPEISTQMEIGAELDLFRNRLHTGFTYYDLQRKQSIFPMRLGSGSTLFNGADIRNRGIEANISYRFYSYDLLWKIELNFSRNRSEVLHLYGDRDEIPYAGFTDIHKSLIEGQPVGVLVGTRFARDKAGNTVIGPDGYPVVHDRLGIIGDPNPDWTAGIQNHLQWRGLTLSFLIALQRGGDVWNGTQSVLNYHGTSQLTAAERYTRDFIFPGVTSEGKVNNVPVNFADSEQGITDNRWVRYGLTGVAEEAVTSASWLRFREISLDYKFPRYLTESLQLSNISMTVFARNPFLFSRYRGSDPNTSLFGYEHGQGLDLFNWPSVRSLGLKLNVTL